jgi:hypothetical protein
MKNFITDHTNVQLAIIHSGIQYCRSTVCTPIFVYGSVSRTVLVADPLWLRKITTETHILAHVNIDCPDNSYPKLKDYISELILYSNESMPAAYITMNYIILP